MNKKKMFGLAGILLLAACFFQFALIGYQTIALFLLGLSLLTLLLGWLQKRWFQRLLAGLTFAGMLCIAVIEVPVIIAAYGDLPADAEYLIVLGAGVNGSTPSFSLSNRLTAAKIWLERHPDSKAILSGGQGAGEEISEAEAMYRWLTAQGIAPERLWKEERSTTTRENFLYSIELLQSNHTGIIPQPVAVVSSEYHLYRAKYLARQLGLETSGVPAKTTLPILRINYFLREAAAVARLWLLGY